jgi:cytochrome c oxidase cbb3-type subunit 3
MRRGRGFVIGSLALALGLGALGCEREERWFRELPALDNRPMPVRLTNLQPGQSLPARESSGPYDGNAYAVSEGKQLYEQFNCVGCHFHGGGGIGPPLMDEQWIYGASTQNIHDTVVQGRPNGMPSYGGHIADDQNWKIAAYVRSLSGQTAKPVSPTRSDDLMASPSEQAKSKQEPKPGEARHPG